MQPTLRHGHAAVLALGVVSIAVCKHVADSQAACCEDALICADADVEVEKCQKAASQAAKAARKEKPMPLDGAQLNALTKS